MIILITGDGKGKTTSALGQALRVMGEGKRAIMVQFIKGPWITGEDKMAKRLAPDFAIIKGGKGFVGILGDTLALEVHKQAARETLALAKKTITSGDYDFVALDEINVALDLRLIGPADVVAMLKAVPKHVTVMLTGRNAPEELYELADIVSEVRDTKHAYAQGAGARRGVEF